MVVLVQKTRQVAVVLPASESVVDDWDAETPTYVMYMMHIINAANITKVLVVTLPSLANL